MYRYNAPDDIQSLFGISGQSRHSPYMKDLTTFWVGALAPYWTRGSLFFVFARIHFRGTCANVALIDAATQTSARLMPTHKQPKGYLTPGH